MSLIVAARFDSFDAAKSAVRRLVLAGFPEWDTHIFYVNSAGEHARYAFGGDRRADPDAGRADLGAILGAAGVGAVFALLGGFLMVAFTQSLAVVLAAAGVGAYLGSLFGALWVTGHGTVEGGHVNPEAHPEVRPAGVMLALHTRPQYEAKACNLLRLSGGTDIEHANGHWRNSHWEDFDPLVPPVRMPNLVETTPPGLRGAGL